MRQLAIRQSGQALPAFQGIIMTREAQYVKIVEWTEEDRCFVGSCPGLFYGSCHGDDEKAVFGELFEIVEETIELFQADGRQD